MAAGFQAPKGTRDFLPEDLAQRQWYNPSLICLRSVMNQIKIFRSVDDFEVFESKFLYLGNILYIL